MNASAIFQALSQSIILSLGQALVIYILSRLILIAFKDMKSSQRYVLSYTSLLVISIGFLISFFSLYISFNEIEKAAEAPVAVVGVQSEVPIQSWKSFAQPYYYWIGWFYLGGLVLQILSLALGLYRLNLQRLNNQDPAPQFWMMRMEKLKAELGIVQEISFQFSESILVPFTVGFLKPVILFPFSAINQLSTDQVEAILLHELAHIKRHDYLLNIIQRVMEIVLFFNPISWMLAREIKAEREFSCDDLVLQHTEKPLIYARALAVMEEHRMTMTSLAMAASGNKKYELLTRIQKITNMKTQNHNQRPRLLALAGILAIGLSLAWIVPADTVQIKTQVDSTRKAQKTLKQLPVPPVPPLAAPPTPALPGKIKKNSFPAPPKPMHPKMVAPPAVPGPPAPADTNKLKKHFDSAEWKAQTEALKKSAEEIRKQFDSPEWKEQMLALQQNSAELKKKFDSPEWKQKMKELEKNSAELEKKFNSPEWKEKMQKLEEHSKEMEKKFNSAEWKAHVKELEKNGAELEKKFNSPEWKAKMKKLEDQSKEMEKKFNSPEWKKKMKDLELEVEKSVEDSIK